MKILLLAVLLPAITLRAAESSSWKIEKQPVLTPGDIGTLDDFAVRDVAVLRHESNWLMLYKGVSLSEQERVSGLGIAESSDGLTWHKPLDEAAIPVKPNEDPSSTCLTFWNDSFYAAYVVDSFPTGDGESEGTSERVELALSKDGRAWLPLGAVSGLSLKSPPRSFLRISLHGDGRLLNLWWIGVNQDSQPALCHSVSRDGVNWSQPNTQPASAIDSREILGARISPSDDFFILVYLASINPNELHVVTKISRDARTWIPKGPPEFVLPAADSKNIATPEMIFTPEGARLFYSETQLSGKASRGAVLRSAFCPKNAYAK